jgi:hypothetical protein
MQEPPQPPSSEWLVEMPPSAAVGARTPAAQLPARAAGVAISAAIPPTTLWQPAFTLHHGCQTYCQLTSSDPHQKLKPKRFCIPCDLGLCCLAGQRQARHRAQLYAVVGHCWVSNVAGALGHHKVDCACKIRDSLSGKQKIQGTNAVQALRKELCNCVTLSGM